MKVVNRRGKNKPQPKEVKAPVNINPDDLDDIICEKCGNPTFVPASLFKKLPASLSPSGQATLIPIQVFECSACRWINDEFLPKMPPKTDE